MSIYDTKEGVRLVLNQQQKGHWNRWGPFLSERAWGTVREDYSANGDAWNYLPHDQEVDIVASKVKGFAKGEGRETISRMVRVQPISSAVMVPSSTPAATRLLACTASGALTGQANSVPTTVEWTA